jgi:hypothetical protein
MLKIDIDDSGKSIYKAINNKELMLYKISGDTVNDLNLIHRLEELLFIIYQITMTAHAYSMILQKRLIIF